MEILKDYHRKYLTLDEVCNLCRCSKKFVYKWMARGKFPGVTRVGRTLLFREQEIERRLANGCLLLP